HANESLAALHEGIGAGRMGLVPAAAEGESAAALARIFRDRADRLRSAWASAGRRRRVVSIAGCPLAADVMEGVAALEIAVHGWDMSQACGHRRPIPQPLAAGLLTLAPLLVPETGRHPLFAAPAAVPPGAGPSDRLTAFLGRTRQA
ncbi:MAG: maleylpyruvate isomerase N-terminal domain-containing protein, partial [Streptosporangiaceae bacterium]